MREQVELNLILALKTLRQGRVEAAERILEHVLDLQNLWVEKETPQRFEFTDGDLMELLR